MPDIHFQSVETLHVPLRQENPTTGPVTLSGDTIEVALPASGASPSTWVATTWATGTSRRGDARFYMAKLLLSDFTLSAGTTYQPWVRVGGASGAIIKVPDTIRAINS